MSFLPGGYDPMSAILGQVQGVGGLMNRGPSWLPQNAQFGQKPGFRGLLGDPNFALSLLANSGPSAQPRSFGQIFGQSALQANQMAQDQQDADFKRKYMEAQIGAMGRDKQSSVYGAVQPDKFTPESLAKFEQTGKYSDLVLRNIGQQYGRYNPGDFTTDSWAEFIKSGDPSVLSRYVTPQNASIEDLAGGKSIVQPSKTGGAPRITPLTTAPQEIAAASARKEAEAQAGAIGAGAGATQADIYTKASDAQTMLATIQRAEGLLDKATGSFIGNVIDKGAAAFGKSTEGAKAGASLQVLQAGLLSFVPKMSGPQSDADRIIYIQAVGQIGDPNSPRETRKAALKTVQDMQKQYIERASQPFRPTIFMPGSPESNNAKVDEFNKYLDKYAPR